jgi:hypothetical protein
MATTHKFASTIDDCGSLPVIEHLTKQITDTNQQIHALQQQNSSATAEVLEACKQQVVAAFTRERLLDVLEQACGGRHCGHGHITITGVTSAAIVFSYNPGYGLKVRTNYVCVCYEVLFEIPPAKIAGQNLDRIEMWDMLDYIKFIPGDCTIRSGLRNAFCLTSTTSYHQV